MDDVSLSDTASGFEWLRPSAATGPLYKDDSSAATTRDLLALRTRGDAATCRAIDQMLLAIALCHTIVPSFKEDDQSTVAYQARLVKLIFWLTGLICAAQGASPDEVALVLGAAQMGYPVVRKQSEWVTIEVDGCALVKNITLTSRSRSTAVMSTMRFCRFSNSRRSGSVCQ